MRKIKAGLDKYLRKNNENLPIFLPFVPLSTNTPLEMSEISRVYGDANLFLIVHP
jgi:hypothetical protein